MHNGDCATGSGGFVNAGDDRERQRWLPLRNLLIVAAVGAALGRLGPFDTFSELAPAARYAYWIGLTLLMWVQIAAAMHLLRDWLDAWHWLPRTLLAAAIGAVPTAFEVAWAEGLLRVARDLTLADVARIYGDVALLAVTLALPLEPIDGLRLLPPRGRRDGPAPTAAPVAGADPLVAALPPERRGALLALEAEDHYLRIHTDRGSALVHRRFGDALAEVAGLDGLRVHRSWWVARGAIDAVERDGDRLTLRLRGGPAVPVSRTYALAVREAGLLPS